MPRQTLRSVRGRRPYVEAFPAVDALALERAWAGGETCCQWTNEQGVVVGHVEIERLTADAVVIRTQFLGAVNVGYKVSVDGYGLVRRRHNENHDRLSFVCPNCRQLFRFIHNVAGHWGCRKCHDLVAVSSCSMVSPSICVACRSSRWSLRGGGRIGDVRPPLLN